MEVNQYMEIFLEESKEHLQSLNEELLLLEKNPKNTSLINEIFRSAHTLKGMAATMGFENMATLTHEMENLLDLARNNKKEINSDTMDTVFHSVDLLEQMVLSISEGGDDNLDATHVIDELRGISDPQTKQTKPSVESSNKEVAVTVDEARPEILLDEYERTIMKQSIESGLSIYQLVVKIEEETILKSARAYMVIHELEKAGEVFKTIPDVELIENEEFGDSFTVIFIGNQEVIPDIKKELLNISEILEVQITNLTQKDLQIEVSVNEIEDMEIKIEVEEIEKNEEIKENNNTQSKPKNNKKVEKEQPHHKVNYGKMIRVDIDRLDELMNLFSELVIDRGRLEQLSNEIKHPELTDTVEHMSRISSSLQNNILNLRMVPIEQVFNRFPRMIRDLSKELNKKVNLHIIGEDTELDRTVIDEIGDPLVHLLRNAVDHGLESVDERKKSKKLETGEIKLHAYHSGNNVFIEVSDDGKGINKEKVLEKAIQKGIISREASHNLSDKQILDLLFASGLSTADQVSDISGRGVGLDVVKTKIEALGGFVTVSSKQGEGTKFVIQLPLTLSIISSMLVQLEDEKFAIPLSSIVETAIYNKSDIMYAHNQEVIDYRGRVIPLVSLKKVFGIPTRAESTESNEISVVLISKGDKMAGILVDSFIGQQEIVLKSLGTYLTNVFAISGATILGDGQVALILDTNALIK